MDIDKDSLKDAVLKSHYTSAIQSIEKHGRYWFSDTRPAASMLEDLLQKAKKDVILIDFPPVWESVICLVDSYDRDSLLEIAYQRHELLEKGIDVVELPV
ncbi:MULTISPECIES: hypothetical protein [Aeromonas]|uniref:hypothetical protein n=1 Tax=Aeromonas TaxID=642 RepID=UPI001C239736|nr:hypothetical protein [Aeromonas sp. FDAARGOS 1408]ELM3749297.1 hypothetical protein [Aeromonas dhakensis]QXC09632.1 hypothetical protein I6L38_06695 [Aeromonas sp. FDAARGOS 1408]